MRKYFEKKPVLKKGKSPRRLLLFTLLIIICLLLLGAFVAIRYNDKKAFFINTNNKTESLTDRFRAKYYLIVEEIQQEVEKEQTSQQDYFIQPFKGPLDQVYKAEEEAHAKSCIYSKLHYIKCSPAYIAKNLKDASFIKFQIITSRESIGGQLCTLASQEFQKSNKPYRVFNKARQKKKDGTFTNEQNEVSYCQQAILDFLAYIKKEKERTSDDQIITFDEWIRNIKIKKLNKEYLAEELVDIDLGHFDVLLQ